LRGLKASGMTVVVTTHFLDEAERCDGLAILDEGRVVALGSPEALRTSVGGVVVRVVVGDPEAAVKALGVLGRVEREANEVVVRLDRGEVGGALEEVRATVSAAGLELRSVSAMKPTLEDVFAAATGRIWQGGER
ncbi:MAG: DUF4162 domain-containing protein, partial [Verrucomicrobiia bacterium]